MGIFRKAGEWLNRTYDRFVRGEEEAPDSYFEGENAAQGYSAVNAEQVDPQDNTVPVDPFGNGESGYGGRVPYRSRYDQEQDAQGQGAWAQPQQAQQPAQGAWAQPQQTQQGQGAWAQPQQAQGAWAQPQQAQQPAQPQAEAQQPGNVVPFPGMQMGPDGSVYSHVEYVVLLRSRGECKEVIAYIKSNASVFLNMEFIASDNERQRCVDMLSGAAYTLGCALNKISPRGIYLISAPTVRVVLDPAMQKFSAAPEAQGFSRQRYDAEGYQAQYQPPRTEQNQPAAEGFSAGSPTMRFQAQSTQRMPASFGSMMTGSAQQQGYQQTGHYAAVQP